MAESLTNYFQELGLAPELVIFVVSLLPIIELRGGLIAAAILGVEWYVALPLCIVGNMLPIPFILLFIRKVFGWLKKITWLQGTIEKLETKTRKKGEKIQKK